MCTENYSTKCTMVSGLPEYTVVSVISFLCSKILKFSLLGVAQ